MPRKINAMVVEDSVMTRKMIMRDLSAAGLAEFQFTEADDGVEALEKFTPGELDILFVDMQMPRMGGVEFLKRLHASHKDCPPAVMITSENSQTLVEQAIREGRVDGFMLKPVDADRLRCGLKKLVDSLPDRAGPSAVPYGECLPDALTEVLATACNLKIEPAPENPSLRHGAILIGGISILGEIQWSIVVGFPKTVAVALVERFAGFEIPADSPDMGDAISEIANQVAGRVKHLLVNRGLDVEISLPVVHIAESFRTLVQRNCTREYRHFNTEVGEIWCGVTVGITPGLIL